MASNRYVNRVIYGNRILIDTSITTVTPDKLAAGYTAIDARGALIVGTANVGGEIVYYGECDTAAESANKVALIGDVTKLKTGLSVRIKFENAQGYDGTPTLNIGLGAISIKRNGNTNASLNEWGAGDVLDFVYDGTTWIIVNGGGLKIG